jgi:hypothetical protein
MFRSRPMGRRKKETAPMKEGISAAGNAAPAGGGNRSRTSGDLFRRRVCDRDEDRHGVAERRTLLCWLGEVTDEAAAFGERLQCGQCRHQWPSGEWAILLSRKEDHLLLFVIPLLRTGRLSDEGRFREVPRSADADGLTLGATEEIPMRVSLRTCLRSIRSTSVPAGRA